MAEDSPPGGSDRFRGLRDNPRVDVLVIGAGINGIATFCDLALQGVSVAIVDGKDFSSGSSAASSHMIHGGFATSKTESFGWSKNPCTSETAFSSTRPTSSLRDKLSSPFSPPSRES